MYFVYVLTSTSNSKRYCGLTSDLNRRLREHNSGKMRSTKAFKPWKMAYYEEFDSRKVARQREKFFKTGEGRELLDQILG